MKKNGVFMSVNFLISNVEGWSLKVSVEKSVNWSSEGTLTKKESIGFFTSTPEKIIALKEVQFLWSTDIKPSKSPAKTLLKECRRIEEKGATDGFEVCEHEGKIYLVFGRYAERNWTLRQGLVILAGGVGTLAAAPILFGAGAAAAIGIAAGGLIGYGSTQALDAYKKDGTNFDGEENRKQSQLSAIGGMAGALVGPVMGLAGRVPGVAQAVSQLGSKVQLVAKVVQPATSNFVGFVTTKKIKGEAITLTESITAVTVGGLVGAAGAGMDRVLPLADTADDLVNAVGNAAMKGAVGAGVASEAGHWLQNPTGKNREWTDIGFAMAVGGVAAGSSKWGEMMKSQLNTPTTTPAVNKNDAQEPSTTSSKAHLEGELSKLANEAVSLNDQAAQANEAWAKHRNNVDRDYGSNIYKKLKHGWGFDGEKPPKKDIIYHKDQLLNRIANGEAVTLDPPWSSDHSSKTYGRSCQQTGQDLVQNKVSTQNSVSSNLIRQQQVQQQLQQITTATTNGQKPYVNWQDQKMKPSTASHEDSIESNFMSEETQNTPLSTQTPQNEVTQSNNEQEQANITLENASPDPVSSTSSSSSSNGSDLAELEPSEESSTVENDLHHPTSQDQTPIVDDNLLDLQLPKVQSQATIEKRQALESAVKAFKQQQLKSLKNQMDRISAALTEKRNQCLRTKSRLMKQKLQAEIQTLEQQWQRCFEATLRLK
jgi:hypothetical protein